MTVACSLSHRGFRLRIEIRPRPGRAARYGYRLSQEGETLCVSEARFRSVASAERAGRHHVDDALAAFDWATARLEPAA